MDEWRIRQEIFHRLNPDHEDNLENFSIEISQDIIGDAIKYFTNKKIGFVYPGKSYMVGICYAKWLSEEFGGNPEDYLNDPGLLYYNDPYFKPYNVEKQLYDAILEQIGGWNFEQNQGLVPDVRKYFVKEFSIT